MRRAVFGMPLQAPGDAFDLRLQVQAQTFGSFLVILHRLVQLGAGQTMDDK